MISAEECSYIMGSGYFLILNSPVPDYYIGACFETINNKYQLFSSLISWSSDCCEHWVPCTLSRFMFLYDQKVHFRHFLILGTLVCIMQIRGLGRSAFSSS